MLRIITALCGECPDRILPFFEPVLSIPDPTIQRCISGTSVRLVPNLFTLSPLLKRRHRKTEISCRFLWRQTFYCHSGVLFTCPMSALRLWYARSCHSEQPIVADTLQAASLRLWGRGPALLRRAGGGVTAPPPLPTSDTVLSRMSGWFLFRPVFSSCLCIRDSSFHTGYSV